MNPRVVLFAAVALSVGVSAVVTLLLQTPRPVAAPPASGVALSAEHLASLEARIEALETKTPPVQALRETSDPRTPVAESVADGSELVALQQRIARLEQAVAMVHGAQPAAPTAHQPDDEPVQIAALSLPELENAILDPSVTAEVKARLHQKLRRVENAYTPAMVDELIRIAQMHDQDELRANVWRDFDGSSHIPALVPPLLQALQVDASDQVRNEAAETLGNYTEQAHVVAALRHAAEHDSSHRVRSKARRTLIEEGFGTR